MHSLFSIEEGAALLEQTLTPLQRAELTAALNLHALLNPGRTLHVEVSTGEISQMPVFSGQASEHAQGGVPVASLKVLSLAVPGGSGGGHDGAQVVRHVRLAHADATPATTRPPRPLSPARRVYGFLERRTPLIVDAVREAIMRRRERAIASRLPRYPDAPGDAELAQAYAALDPAPGLPAAAGAEGPPAILFGMHWLQTGGAERWAIESVGIAKEQGFLPVIVADQNSVHPWLTRPEIEGCVVILLSSETHESDIEAGLAAALLANFELRGIMIHHCYWLYRALPWIKRQRPELPVVDSLHIVEYLGGGYPGISARFDDSIDLHHVISPELKRWLVEEQGIAQDRVAMAPLTALTVDESRGFVGRDASRPFTLAYLGRLSRQKRPDLFILLMHRLRIAGLNVRAIMHGDGELRDTVDALISHFDLAGLIEQRFEDAPVPVTLADADLLVITSINEGLTLTTFEALAAGVPVLSTDVGSQRTIVQGNMLLERPARPFLRGAVAVIRQLALDESERERVWAEQQARVTEFSHHSLAHQFTKEIFAQWQQ